METNKIGSFFGASLMNGKADYLWAEEHRMLRESSPTYQLGKKIFKKYSKNFYGDVLEIGCGVEVWQKEILSRNKNIRSYLGLDNSKLVLDKLQGLEYKNFKFVRADANDLQINSMFDCILLWGVIEHIRDDKKLMIWIAEHLKQGGLLYVDFPLRPSIWSEMDVQTGHFRRYKLREVREIMSPYSVINYEFVETFSLKFYRLLTMNRKDRNTISREDRKVRFLKKITPLLLGFDWFFNKVGFWGNAVVILARKG